MRFVSLVNSIIGKARRGVSQGLSVGVGSGAEDESTADPARLVEQMRQMMARINRLEASAAPDAVEFEVNVGTGGAITELVHKLNGPVRWWVTAWLQTSGTFYPVGAPILAQDSTSDANRLYLRSYVAGRAVVRVEAAQNYLDPGTIVVASPDQIRICLNANKTTTSQTIVSSGLSWQVSPGEQWKIDFHAGVANSAAGGSKYGVIAPAGCTIDAWEEGALNAINARGYTQIAAINTLGQTFNTIAGGERDYQIHGTLKVGATGGTVSIGMATVTAATTSTMFAKSHLAADKLIGV